jgi:hypothetical protein
MENSYIRIALLAISAWAISSAAQAQDAAPKDPLGKPKVWEELAGHPEDSVMWARYFAKPLACMSKHDRDRMAAWRGQLERDLAAVGADVSASVNWEEPVQASESTETAITREYDRAEAELQAHIARLEETMVGEQQLITDLKQNIPMNFFIIEELYEEEFRSLGVAYKSYLTVHPGGKYSKQEWLEEKEQELQKLKKKQFEHLKKRLLKNARKHGYGGAPVSSAP